MIREPILTLPRQDGLSSLPIPLTFGPSALSAYRALSNQLPARNCSPLGKPSCGLSMLAGHVTFGSIAKRSSMASSNCNKERLSHPSVSTRISNVFLPFRTSSPTSIRSTRCTPIRVTLTALLAPNGLKKRIGLWMTLLGWLLLNGGPTSMLRGTLPTPTMWSNAPSLTLSCSCIWLPPGRTPAVPL